MRSRYDLMDNSTVVGTDGTPYKDVFTLPLQKFTYRENIVEKTLSQTDINRPDYLGSTLYQGESELDDIVLMLNKIGLLQYSNTGDILEVPVQLDLENFYFKYRK